MTAKHNEPRLRARCTRQSQDAVPPTAFREALAVVLLCAGALTVLALASFSPNDLSLNASSVTKTHNLIGPVGAYWADVLLQTLGLGAYLLGLGCLLASWRAFFGRKILPGLREALGTILLAVASGGFLHLLIHAPGRDYPPGGVLGAMLGQFLVAHFASLGAYILASALCLLCLALTTDGILWGLGWRSVGAAHRVGGLVALWHAHGRALYRRMMHLAAVKAADTRLPAPTSATRRKQRPRGQPVSVVDTHPEPHGDPQNDDAMPEVVTARGIDAPDRALGQSDDPPLDEVVPVGPQEARLVPKSATVPPRSKKASSGAPEIVNVRPDLDPTLMQRAEQEPPPAKKAQKAFELPSVSLLDYEATVRPPTDHDLLLENAQRLTKTLKDYGIEGHVREIRPGPVVTMYEYVPGPGIKLSKIASLADDLAMSMEALRVRIVAPIPGKGAVGIEIPNEIRETVYLKEIIANDTFRKAHSPLTMALGKDIEGGSYVADLARMPHLLVAGATGAGKSVSINAMIMSVLFKATPDEVRMIMVDPKMLELSVYEGIPHLLLPVVTDPKKAALALRWAVEEMERRYELLSTAGVRSIDGLNQKIREAEKKGQPYCLPNADPDAVPQPCAPLPYLCIIVDELADLMMVASREVEMSIMRLAQMARAAGIHLILATQRPSVDVLTGVIKANFPTRIAFQVASRHDSRTIIDSNGAEHLLGRGDMLYLSPGAGGIMRVHGAFVSDEEIARAVEFVRKQGTPEYDESILAPREDCADGEPAVEEIMDEMYDQAVAIVAETRQASISMIQRRLRIGYNRAARMVERMETEGIVGPADGAKPRDVLVSHN